MGSIEEFKGLVAQAIFPLDRAMLLIASSRYRDLDLEAELLRFDHLAQSVEAPTLDGLVGSLFKSGGFVGNSAEYYDADNSYLNRVLDRRLGIPITLAIVTIEVGRRIGVELRGVGMPGHFLLVDTNHQNRFVDAFSRGRILTDVECRSLYLSMAHPGASWNPVFLEPVTSLAIVTRVLANLALVYERNRDFGNLSHIYALRCVLPTATDREHEAVSRLQARFN